MNFLESYLVRGRVPSTGDSVMPIMRVSGKVSSEDFVDIIVNHKEELVKGAENQGIGFKVVTVIILKN